MAVATHAACERVSPAERRPLLLARVDVSCPPVWGVRLDGGDRTRLPGIEGGRGLALSPHGCQVAYVKTRPDGDGDELWVADADGTHRMRIGGDRRTMDDPAWSPVGTRLAVAINGGGLGVLDAAGGTSCSGTARPACAITSPQLAAGPGPRPPAWSLQGCRGRRHATPRAGGAIGLRRPHARAPLAVDKPLWYGRRAGDGRRRFRRGVIQVDVSRGGACPPAGSSGRVPAATCLPRAAPSVPA